MPIQILQPTGADIKEAWPYDFTDCRCATCVYGYPDPGHTPAMGIWESWK